MIETIAAEASTFAVTAQLALATTTILLLIALPLGWWLAVGSSWPRTVIETTIAMPLVMPPTVLGFYALTLMSPNSPLGRLWLDLTGNTLTFSFSGLVIASCFYSAPFVIQPIQSAFKHVGREYLDTAQTLGLSPLQGFFRVIIPMAKSSIVSAAALGFAHTVGEFGVVLMVGGNIPNETRVLSIAIYDQVEMLNYETAHTLSLLLIVFSFAVLLTINRLQKRGDATLVR